MLVPGVCMIRNGLMKSLGFSLSICFAECPNAHPFHLVLFPRSMLL